MRRLICRPVLVALGLATAVSMALAQSTSPSPKNAPEQNAPSQFDAQSRQQRGQTLSERLDRSDGVIRPPGNVDPKIGVAPPATGDKMPVVPPDPNVKPK